LSSSDKYVCYDLLCAYSGDQHCSVKDQSILAYLSIEENMRNTENQ
jgi:hypothetical protein